MAFFAHYFSALVYVALGYVVAFLLPQRYPELDQFTAYAYGGMVTLLLLLFHALRALGSARRRLNRDIRELREAQETAEAELETARKEIQRLRERSPKSDGQPSVVPAPVESQRLDKVVNEVKVLQDLVGKLSAGAPESVTTPVAVMPDETPLLLDQPILEDEPEATPQPEMAAPEPVVPAITPRRPPGAKGTGPRELPPVAEGLDEATILNVVREGLKSDRVELVLQPIVRLPQRKRTYYECFSRIHDGAGRIVVPEQYIEVARDAGLIAPIDNMLLFRCIQLIRRVRKAHQDVGFFCNISSHSLSDTPFLRDFIAFMAENVELAPNLIFEFAQADIADMNEDVAFNLQRLADLGFRFSMDQVVGLDMDYAELARHRFRFVKLEANALLGLIHEELHAGGGPAQVGGFQLRDFKARLDRLNMGLVVEKIETEKDLVELLDYKIDYGQGYLFGEPRMARPAA